MDDMLRARSAARGPASQAYGSPGRGRPGACSPGSPDASLPISPLRSPHASPRRPRRNSAPGAGYARCSMAHEADGSAAVAAVAAAVQRQRPAWQPAGSRNAWRAMQEHAGQVKHADELLSCSPRHDGGIPLSALSAASTSSRMGSGPHGNAPVATMHSPDAVPHAYAGAGRSASGPAPTDAPSGSRQYRPDLLPNRYQAAAAGGSDPVGSAAAGDVEGRRLAQRRVQCAEGAAQQRYYSQVDGRVERTMALAAAAASAAAEAVLGPQRGSRGVSPIRGGTQCGTGLPATDPWASPLSRHEPAGDPCPGGLAAGGPVCPSKAATGMTPALRDPNDGDAALGGAPHPPQATATAMAGWDGGMAGDPLSARQGGAAGHASPSPLQEAYALACHISSVVGEVCGSLSGLSEQGLAATQ